MKSALKKGRKPTAPVDRLRVIFLVFYLCKSFEVKSTRQLSISIREASNSDHLSRAWEGALRNGHTPSTHTLIQAFKLKPKSEKLFNHCIWIALDSNIKKKEHWLTIYPYLSVKGQKQLHRYFLLTTKERSNSHDLDTLFDFFKLEIKETVACLLVLYEQATSESEQKNILLVTHQALTILLTSEPFYTLRSLFISYVKAYITQRSKKAMIIWEEKARATAELLITLSERSSPLFPGFQKNLPSSVTNYLKVFAIKANKKGNTYGLITLENDLLSELKLSSIIPELQYLSEQLKPPDLIKQTISSLFSEIKVTPLKLKPHVIK